MSSSDKWFIGFWLVWLLLSNVDFSLELGHDKAGSFVMQTRDAGKPSEVKKEESSGDIPKPSW